MIRVPTEDLLYDEGLMWFDGEPFTGIGYSLNVNGDVDEETEYHEGLKSGFSRIWYLPDVLFQESRLFMGSRHGRTKEWYPNGQLKEDGEYELGFTLWKKAWDEDGDLTEEFEMKETDDSYVRLQRFREIYKEDLAREEARRRG